MNTIDEDFHPRHSNESKVEEGELPSTLPTNHETASNRWRGLGDGDSHDKHVGLANAAVSAPSHCSLAQDEKRVAQKIAGRWRLTHFLQRTMANLLVLICYLITIETVVSVGLTVGLTFYFHHIKKDNNAAFNGGTIDFVFLGFGKLEIFNRPQLTLHNYISVSADEVFVPNHLQFKKLTHGNPEHFIPSHTHTIIHFKAVITPITVSLGLAFGRREQALREIRIIRSCCFQMYNAHAIWNWNVKDPNSSGRVEAGINWLQHTDKVLDQLIGMGDELSRFLTLPTSSRSYHRTMSCGRSEAAEIVEVAYRLFDSLYTQRLTQLSFLNEKFKTLGVSHSEASRLRQYERYIGESMEALRMIKMYRTPQALRAFGRIFTLIIPPFYAPRFAQVAYDLNSLFLGICFAIITSFALTALYESTQILEDPFVGYVSLDGIDVMEEFEVLHWHQLINCRKVLFPHAEDFNETSLVPIDTWQPTDDKPVGREKSPLSKSVRSSRYVLADASKGLQ